MANPGQSFLFRLPWLGQQQTPQSKPTRPTKETRTPAQMTAALAGQRVAPTPSQPSKTQPPTEPRAASQPSSPSRPKTQTPSSSPSRAVASSATSKPRTDTKTTSSPTQSVRETTSQAASPSRLQPKVDESPPQMQSEVAKKEEDPVKSISPADNGEKGTAQKASSDSAALAAPQPTLPLHDESPVKTTPPADNGEEGAAQKASDSVAAPPAPSQPALPLQEESPVKPADNGKKGVAQKASDSVAALPAPSQPALPLEEESPVKTTPPAYNDEKGAAQKTSDSDAAPPAPSQPALSLQEESPVKPADNSKKGVAQKASDSVAAPPAPSQPALPLQEDNPLKTTDKGKRGTAQEASDSVAAVPAPSQQEDKAAVSQPALLLQESQPTMEITPEKISTSPLKATTTSLDDDREVAKISKDEVSEAIGLGQKSDDGRDQKVVSKLEEESMESVASEGKQTVEEFPKEDVTKKPSYEEEPIQKTSTEHIPTVTTSRSKYTSADATNVAAFGQEKWQQQKQETWDKEHRVATTSYTGKQFKTVGSSGNMSNSTFQKPVWSMDDQPQAQRQNEIKEDIFKLVHKLTTEHKLIDCPVTVITLTGENRGASMNVTSEPAAKKQESIHIHRGYKSNPDESVETTDGEISSPEGRRLKDDLSKEAPPIKAYANSNVQTINNSVVFNASTNTKDPGIHLEFPEDNAEPTRLNGRSESHHARRSQFSITPSEKLTHEHTVKRRCLRGLFLESSDSEPDNPEKPRRHGCRYGCFDNKKDKEFGA